LLSARLKVNFNKFLGLYQICYVFALALNGGSNSLFILDRQTLCHFGCSATVTVVWQAKRLKAVSSSCHNITRLLSELELSPRSAFERDVVSDGDMSSLTLDTMDTVKKYNDEVSDSFL